MNTDTTTRILDLGARWARAEQDADTRSLDAMTVADFRLVGPFGFVLDKAAWLDRYTSGNLVTSSLAWDDVEVREFGDTAIAIGRHTQQAAHQGQNMDGQFRDTLVFVRDGDGWLLASVHISLGTPPGPPAGPRP